MGNDLQWPPGLTAPQPMHYAIDQGGERRPEVPVDAPSAERREPGHAAPAEEVRVHGADPGENRGPRQQNSPIAPAALLCHLDPHGWPRMIAVRSCVCTPAEPDW